MHQPQPISNSSLHTEFTPQHESHRFSSLGNQGSKHLTGKLPKINFPKFEGENPKLWKFRGESYFDMYVVDISLWVKVATMHFEGPVVRWLQSVDHRVKSASWSELCSWIHECFGKD
jgi:hypothetical protein